MTYALRRPSDSEINWLFTVIVIGWGGVVGSTITVLLIGAILWNLVYLSAGRLSLDVEREARLVAAGFAAFFITVVIAELVNYEHRGALVEIIENLPFLGFLLFYAALARGTRFTIVSAVQFGAVTGAYATFVVVLYQVVYLGASRPAGGAGNAGPLATISALLYCLCLATAVRQQGWRRASALIAAACAAATLLLSGMRGIWPVILIGPMIPLLVYRQSLTAVRPMRIMAIGLLVVAGVGFVSYGIVLQRVMLVAQDFERITVAGDYNNSIGHRIVIWQAGIDLVREKPIVGHGSSDIRSLMASRTQALTGMSLGYSHFHNFMLNAAVRSGLLGVAGLLAMILMPLWLALRRRGDDVSDFGFAMLLSLHLTFIASGLTNIMLHHDIMDTLFIYGSATCCFLIFKREVSSRNPAAADNSRMRLRTTQPLTAD